jgi:uncharacterized protein with von Willebrand factor type A (vWA) domain
MPRTSDKKVSCKTKGSNNSDAINDVVDETVDFLVDDVIDDTDTESCDSQDSQESQDLQESQESQDLQDLQAEQIEEVEKEIKEYSVYDKEVMVKKISRLQLEEHKQIRKIIKRHKPDKKMKKVSGGSYLYFHNLDNVVYHEIDEYLNELSKKNKEKLQRYMSETENFYNSTEERKSASDMESTMKARLRLSNRERHMLNRQRFDKIRTDEIKESIQMNNKKRERKSSTRRNIDLTTSTSEKKRGKTINIGTSDINTVFDTLSQKDRSDVKSVTKKRANRNKSSKSKNKIFSKTNK